MNRSAREHALTVSLLQRAERWRQAERRARRLARGRSEDAADATRLADDYRLLAHDLARVRTLLPDSRTREYLEAAYARAHATLHHGAWRIGSGLLTLFRDEIPAVVRWLRPYILWSTVIFALAVMGGYALVQRYPELIALFASPDLIATVENGQLWTEGLLNIVPSSVLSVQILANNIVVSLFAYCAGFLFGLGTLYILGLNGLMLGAVFAFVGRHGLGQQLLSQPGPAHEREDRAQHQAVESQDIKSAQSEQEPGAVGEQAHDDVVRQNLHRQHRGGHDIQQPLRPQLAALHAGDQIGGGEQRDELRVTPHQCVTAAHRQREDCRRPQDVRPEPAHHRRNLLAEQPQKFAADTPGAVMQCRVPARVSGFQVLAGARVRHEGAHARQIVGQQAIVVRQAGGVPGILAAPAGEAAARRSACRQRSARCSRLTVRACCRADPFILTALY